MSDIDINEEIGKMNIKSIYDTVTLRHPCSHNQFLTHLDLTLRTLMSQFGMKYVISGDSYCIPRSIEDDIPVFDEYYAAAVDNILFLLTGDGDRKTDYVAESSDAYKTVWSKLAKGKKIVGGGYSYV